MTRKYENTERMYYCLASDGLLYILGDHGDYEAANETAEQMGLDVIWLVDAQTARSWRDTLTEAT